MNKKRKIVILGGGTAGWMCANLIQHRLAAKHFTTVVIESPDIGIIGVGEGSTPQLKVFFDTLGIAEKEWMPICNATYKNGIRFVDWSLNTKHTSYFHPFPSMPDRQTAGGFLINCLSRRLGHDVDPHPDQFFLSTLLAEQLISPKTKAGFPFTLNYGYHFDSGLLGNFLKLHAIEQGVEHKHAKVVEVKTHLDGSISSLLNDDGSEISGDVFIDCSGFNSLLMQKTLGVKFRSFEENLFNDAAVAIPTRLTSSIGCQTRSIAMPNGWRWEIPLTSRIGNGYVYSSKYIDSTEAETQLRQSLDLVDSDVPAKHLKMKVGQVEKHWHKNCISIGLSQGFIEPLEATALHLVQETVDSFISAFEAGGFSNTHQQEFNQRIRTRFEGVRDYIVCHYKTNSRSDTPYWQDNRNNLQISDSLQAILDCWDKGGDLTEEIDRQKIAAYYPAVSWHCLLAGVGRFPPLGITQAATHEVNVDEISRFIQQCAQGFIPHKQALKYT